MAWVSIASLAPWRSNSSEMSRERLSGISFPAPIFASLLLSSFPRVPWWPFTHLKAVSTNLLLRRYAALLKNSMLLILIQPLSSQSWRCLVNPFMMYCRWSQLQSSFCRSLGVFQLLQLLQLVPQFGWIGWCLGSLLPYCRGHFVLSILHCSVHFFSHCSYMSHLCRLSGLCGLGLFLAEVGTMLVTGRCVLGL